MAIDFATFISVAPHVLNSRLPVLIRGRHGVGKSEVVYMIAAGLELPVVERRASQMTEGDLLGLPDTADTTINGRKATTWNAPDWLVTACEQPVLLFLDEVDRATLEVRQGLFELTDSRKLNGWHLHPETLICAAVNGGVGIHRLQGKDRGDAHGQERPVTGGGAIGAVDHYPVGAAIDQLRIGQRERAGCGPGNIVVGVAGLLLPLVGKWWRAGGIHIKGHVAAHRGIGI